MWVIKTECSDIQREMSLNKTALHGVKSATLARHKRPQKAPPRDIPVCVVGLGLMATGIAPCLLAAGHPVTGVNKNLNPRRVRAAPRPAARDEP